MKQTIFFDLGGVILREAESNLHKAEDTQLQKILNGSLPTYKIFYPAFELAQHFCGNNCQANWFLGTTTGQEIVSAIEDNIDKSEYDYLFANQELRSLIKHGSKHVLLPDLATNLTEIIDEALLFLEKCKKKNIEIAIISNWDPYSFELIKNKFPELFNLFPEQNIIIPAQIGVCKPSVKIYEHAIKKLECNLNESFFVDDNQKNIESSQSYGITSIHHKNWEDTETELKSRGLLI
jgi:FMN phosphatase YigB (HAD superfamily)